MTHGFVAGDLLLKMNENFLAEALSRFRLIVLQLSSLEKEVTL